MLSVCSASKISDNCYNKIIPNILGVLPTRFAQSFLHQTGFDKWIGNFFIVIQLIDTSKQSVTNSQNPS